MAIPNQAVTAVNLQSLNVGGLNQILEASRYRWLVADEIHAIMARRSDFVTSGNVPPQLFIAGLYFYEGTKVPAFGWDLVVEAERMDVDINFTTVEATALNGDVFERRAYRCRSRYRDLVLVHYRKIRPGVQ